MKRIKFITVPLAMGAILLSVAALAAPPPECRGFRSATYQAAYDTRVRYLHVLFENRYDCNSFENFASAARQILLTSTFADPCQGAGIKDATNDTLDTIARQCFNISSNHTSNPVPGGEVLASEDVMPAAASCEQMGDDAGTSAARMYCAAAMGPIRGLPAGCGAQYTYACKRAFYMIVEQDPSCQTMAASDPHFKGEVDSACAPQF